MTKLPIVIDIPSPCAANWEAMAGGAQVRHCALCDKDVHLLSGLSAARVAALLQRGACVRFDVAPDGAVIHRGWKPGRAARIVATAALAALAACGKQLGGSPPIAVADAIPAASTPTVEPQLVPVAPAPEGSAQLMGAPPPIKPPKPSKAGKRAIGSHTG